MKLILFVIIYMFYKLAWYDVFYIQSLCSACMDLFECNK